MSHLLLAAAVYGGYISIVKLIIFIIIFLLMLLVINWVHQDAKAVGTNEVTWTSVVFGSSAAGAIVWLITPIFIVGLLFCLIAASVSSLSYVMHRNSRVMDFDRVLTIEHIKGLFADKQKDVEKMKGFIFITANNNEVPLPEPKTPDFLGYRLAYELFTDAAWHRASDVIFSPTAQDYSVVYQVDGSAIRQPSIPKEQMEYFTRFVKLLAAVDPKEKRKPQKGKFRIYQNKTNIYWEVTTSGSTAGEQVNLRHIIKQSLTKLTDIGLSATQNEQLKQIRQLKQGLFIISGPPKSGVTTTFYAFLRNHDAFLNSINTLERQPNFELVNITQNTFSLSDTGTTTFAKKLQSIIRMGADIVGVAGCEDTETAQIACAAAKDGKIIYLTLESDNIMQTLGKWIKLVGSKNLAADTILGMTNQRLLRKLCIECRQAYEPNKELLHKFSIPPEKAKVLYRAGKVKVDKHGRETTCENCQGIGFVGRISIFEIIMINDELREVIRQSKSLSEIATQFRRAKMLYLQEQALLKVVDGITSINEMVRVLSSGKRKADKQNQQDE